MYCVAIAASKVKTRSSNLAKESSHSFAKQLDDYIKNCTVFKQANLKAFNDVVGEIIKPLDDKIASLKCEVKMLKSEHIEASAKGNDKEH